MSMFQLSIANLTYQHHLTHPAQHHGAIDDTFVSHRIRIIDLSLTLVDLKQREVAIYWNSRGVLILTRAQEPIDSVDLAAILNLL
jgi:hypothetical protein